MRILGDTIYMDFVTHNPSTGNVQDADSTPTCEVFEDSNDTAILTPTVTKRSGKTGNYRIPVAATAGNGFEIGKSYNVVIQATVGGVTGKGVIGRFTLDSQRLANDIEGSIDIAGALRLLLAFICNKCSGGGTSTITFRDVADSKDRIVAAVDANGNRTTISLRDPD